MGLLDKLKKKDQSDDNTDSAGEDGGRRVDAAEFTFIRTDTAGQEIIRPPNDGQEQKKLLSPKTSVRSSPRRSLDVFRSSRSRSESVSSQTSHSSRRRLSERLHLSRQAESSENVPENLPAITRSDPADESQWEQRATMLAGQNELARGRPASPVPSEGVSRMSLAPGSTGRKRSASSSKAIDDDIQQAIRLHEEGDLEQSTKIFGRLADPQGPNNPLSQVLYGLALRHGWGCDPDPAKAITYLTAAASNSAAIEQLALQAGMKKGGAAKGELVMAIFELGNCFRHGWGIKKDFVAARQRQVSPQQSLPRPTGTLTKASTDAMNEAAFCYLNGIGGEKDKYTAARYFRQAEEAGNKTIGNSWCPFVMSFAFVAFSARSTLDPRSYTSLRTYANPCKKKERNRIQGPGSLVSGDEACFLNVHVAVCIASPPSRIQIRRQSTKSIMQTCCPVRLATIQLPRYVLRARHHLTRHQPRRPKPRKIQPTRTRAKVTIAQDRGTCASGVRPPCLGRCLRQANPRVSPPGRGHHNVQKLPFLASPHQWPLWLGPASPRSLAFVTKVNCYSLVFVVTLLRTDATLQLSPASELACSVPMRLDVRHTLTLHSSTAIEYIKPKERGGDGESPSLEINKSFAQNINARSLAKNKQPIKVKGNFVKSNKHENIPSSSIQEDGVGTKITLRCVSKWSDWLSHVREEDSQE
ncbi:hypothetical protein MAC_02986 [Metarhizium acridum CQMa 102]|uniref:Tetratricopeptide-like helical n=1 Tax=Metarhizium acridum (strain CQMa 102) TaxID=655827 RepID=E9DZD8_METAQ|nr:uncharacterized protein MAC_02986 [Metarhizium acridum CQMa 102]EFY90870.1 hypothetical protein MAC_02986 [Metarhizium acridum CQMa 102]